MKSTEITKDSWWRHQMETFSALLALCAGNSPVPGELPAQRPVTRRFDVLFDLRLNKRLSKQSWGWWFETPSGPLWRHCNVTAPPSGANDTWWRHQMESFSALLAICAGNSLVTGEFPVKRPVTQNFDVFFDLRQNKRLSKHWWGWWLETPWRSLWRHCNYTPYPRRSYNQRIQDHTCRCIGPRGHCMSPFDMDRCHTRLYLRTKKNTAWQ